MEVEIAMDHLVSIVIATTFAFAAAITTITVHGPNLKGFGLAKSLR